MLRMPSDDDEEDAPVRKKDDRRASCPIFGCDWKTQKIRNHMSGTFDGGMMLLPIP
jgi:hypothetical protein